MEFTKREAVQATSTPDISAMQSVQRVYQQQIKTMDTVAQIGQQTVKLGLAYRDRNKKSDMMADKLNFGAFKRQVMMGASEEALQTTDKKEIDRIYKEAERQVDEWAGSQTGGVPNVRWKDQVPLIKGEAQNFRQILESERVERNLSVSRANTKAIADRSMAQGVLDNDAVMMKSSTDVMVEAGMMTAEEGKTWYAENARKAELNEGKNLVNLISTKPPVEAEELAKIMKEDVDNYKHLNPDEVALMKSEMDQAVSIAYKREATADAQQKKAKEETYYQASTDMLKGFYDGSITYDSMSTIAGGFGELPQYLDAQKEAWNMTPKRQKKRLESQDYQDIRMDIHNWKKADDPDGSKMRKMMYEIARYGEAGEPMMTELYLVSTGRKIGGIDGEGFKLINQQIEAQIDSATELFKKENFKWYRPDELPAGFVEDIDVGTATKSVMSSEMEIKIKNYMTNLIKDQKMTLDQALEQLDTHPMMVDLKNAQLVQFEANWDTFDRTGRFINEIPIINPLRE